MPLLFFRMYIKDTGSWFEVIYVIYKKTRLGDTNVLAFF